VDREKESPIISVIIVNYNVKEYLAQALISIQRALKKFSSEIIVVDNASIDGSVPYIRKNFPAVRLIQNKQNVGFGRANNQALKIARGKFVVLINPDTVVQENTFEKLLEFFASTPDASAATCKIINPDGTFSVDCRHSIPTPGIAFWKVIGLSKLFPKSKIFGQYNLTYLDTEKTYPVPAISGSFMMIKREVLEKTGYFDERFFMYCEDIDLCHRINQKGFKIYYVPTTKIIHYKGESTKKDQLDYVITFTHSLYKFFKKYYASRSAFLFRWLITLGIFFRGILIYLKNFSNLHFPLILDLVILNSVIFLSFGIRIGIGNPHFWNDYQSHFWVINVITTILFLIISFYFDTYPMHRLSIQSILKSNFVTFIFLSSFTFFIKQFAFSRLVVITTFFISPLLMTIWRAILRQYYRGERAPLGKDLFSKKTALVGSGAELLNIYKRLKLKGDIDYQLIGWISVKEEIDPPNEKEIRYLGALKDINQIIRMHRIRQIIFISQSLSYEQILSTMSNTSNSMVEFKMVPSDMDVIIGKSHIERLEDYPLLDIKYAIGKKFNLMSKRIFDLIISLPIAVFLAPINMFIWLLFRSRLTKYKILDQYGGEITLVKLQEGYFSSIFNIWFLMIKILSGQLSVIGYPYDNKWQEKSIRPLYKPGLTGLVQVNRDQANTPDEEKKFHLFYLKNQSLLLDVEILLKAIWKALIGMKKK